MKIKSIPPLILLFFITSLLMALGYVALYASGISSDRVRGILNMDSEKGIATWFSSIQFFCIFITSALYCRYQVARAQPKSWLLLALPATFLFFSIDEIIQLHEGMGGVLDALLPNKTREGTAFQETGIWMIALGIPFLMACIGWILGVRKYFIGQTPALLKIIIGMGIFLTGALVCESFSNVLAKDSFGLFIEILLEETLELLGSTLLFWGVYQMAQPHFPVFKQTNQ